MKSQVLLAVWCNISGEAAGEFGNWSPLGLKGLTRIVVTGREVEGSESNLTRAPNGRLIDWTVSLHEGTVYNESRNLHQANLFGFMCKYFTTTPAISRFLIGWCAVENKSPHNGADAIDSCLLALTSKYCGTNKLTMVFPWCRLLFTTI